MLSRIERADAEVAPAVTLGEGGGIEAAPQGLRAIEADGSPIQGTYV